MRKAEVKEAKTIFRNTINPILHRLLELAEKRNISTYLAKFPTNIDGLYFKRDNIEVIGLSFKLSEKKLRFVLAHELGHAVLHSNELDFVMYHQYGNYHNVIERQADRFAEKLIKLLEWRYGNERVGN